MDVCRAAASYVLCVFLLSGAFQATHAAQGSSERVAAEHVQRLQVAGLGDFFRKLDESIRSTLPDKSGNTDSHTATTTPKSPPTNSSSQSSPRKSPAAKPLEMYGLSRDQNREIQDLLTELGYSPGPADGLPGEKTRLAIKQYQSDKGLLETGQPSFALLEYMQKSMRQAELIRHTAEPSGSLPTDNVAGAVTTISQTQGADGATPISLASQESSFIEAPTPDLQEVGNSVNSTESIIDERAASLCKGLAGDCTTLLSTVVKSWWKETLRQWSSNQTARRSFEMLFSNPGAIARDTERLQLFEGMLADKEFSESLAQKINSEVLSSKDIGLPKLDAKALGSIASDIGLDLITNLAIEVSAITLEKSGDTDRAYWVRTVTKPSVDIAKLSAGIAAGTTTVAGGTFAAGGVWAKNLYSFTLLGKRLTDDQAKGVDVETKLAELAAQNASIVESLKSGETRGVLYQGYPLRKLTDKEVNVLNDMLVTNNESQSALLEQKAVQDEFAWVVDGAKKFALFISGLSMNAQYAGTEHAISTPALPDGVNRIVDTKDYSLACSDKGWMEFYDYQGGKGKMRIAASLHYNPAEVYKSVKKIDGWYITDNIKVEKSDGILVFIFENNDKQVLNTDTMKMEFHGINESYSMQCKYYTASEALPDQSIFNYSIWELEKYGRIAIFSDGKMKIYNSGVVEPSKEYVFQMLGNNELVIFIDSGSLSIVMPGNQEEQILLKYDEFAELFEVSDKRGDRLILNKLPSINRSDLIGKWYNYEIRDDWNSSSMLEVTPNSITWDGVDVNHKEHLYWKFDTVEPTTLWNNVGIVEGDNPYPSTIIKYSPNEMTIRLGSEDNGHKYVRWNGQKLLQIPNGYQDQNDPIAKWKAKWAVEIESAESWENLTDLLRFNKPTVIAKLNKGHLVRLKYRADKVSFSEGKSVLEDFHLRTDIEQGLNKNQSALEAWAAAVNRKPSFEVYCILDPEDLIGLSEGEKYDFMGKLKGVGESEFGSRVTMDCQIHR